MWDIIKLYQDREPIIYCPWHQLCLPLHRLSAGFSHVQNSSIADFLLQPPLLPALLCPKHHFG